MPEGFWTDNCCVDRPMLLKIFPKSWVCSGSVPRIVNDLFAGKEGFGPRYFYLPGHRECKTCAAKALFRGYIELLFWASRRADKINQSTGQKNPGKITAEQLQQIQAGLFSLFRFLLNLCRFRQVMPLHVLQMVPSSRARLTRHISVF